MSRRQLSQGAFDALPRVGEQGERRRVAFGATTTLDLCPCGAVHLRIGRAVMRLSLDQVTELRALLEISDDILDALCDAEAPPADGLGGN